MTYHADLTGADLHEPKGVDAAAANKVYVTDGAGSGTFQTHYKTDTYVAHISNVGAASSSYVVAPEAGTISKIYSVVDGSTGGADTILTVSIGGVTVTNGTITIATAAVAGEVDEATPTANNTVTAGQAIKVESDGGTTGTPGCRVSFLITRS